MAVAGNISIALDPTHADYDTHGELTKSSITVGTTWEKRNFFPAGRNDIAGAGATSGVVITHRKFMMPKFSWADTRPEFLAELAKLIDEGRITVMDEDTGTVLTPEELQLRDISEVEEQANGVGAANGDPVGGAAGVDVRGFLFSYQMVAAGVPVNAHFKLWIYINGVWAMGHSSGATVNDQAVVIEIGDGDQLQRAASRAYIEVVDPGGETWTLNIVKSQTTRV